jgi:hypothetical protein
VSARRRLAVVAVVTASAGFLLLGWQGISTAGRMVPLDSREYLLNGQYLDNHGRLPPSYVSYEYSAPPLYEAVAVGAERVVRSLPSQPLETRWNTVNRLLWLALMAGAAWGLTSSARRVRLLGVASALLAVAWGLDEAVSLARTEAWSAGQMVSLVSALGLVAVSGLIAREVWPGHPKRALATAAFVLAYPVVLRLGVLFHPESTTALLAALAALVVLRAGRHGWTARAGALAGVLCGLALLTRQSAVVVLFCVVAMPLVASAGRARRFSVATIGCAALVAGPWLAYAAARWGNPLQGNLQQPGSMLPHGEPLSFYVSFPFASLVVHPFPPDLANRLFPELHADLWSDWFGVFRPSRWVNPSTFDRVTASSQSVIGLMADALALGGLAVFGVPALLRLIQRRAGDTDAAYGLLALLALAGVFGLAIQVVRYPQLSGLEIKASYLLFTAPCWAVFSVAAWIELMRRRRRAGTVLVVAAGLYAVSYGAALADGFTKTYEQPLTIVQPDGFVDLRTSIDNTTAGRAPVQGTEADFTVWVTNRGTASAGAPVLVIQLDHDLRLLGPPAVVRGPGCTGTGTITCPFGFLPAGASTPVRFGVELAGTGPKTLTASASSNRIDANSRDNQTPTTLDVVPPG